MPQFSDLPIKAFLGSTGAAANSYVLINYADNQQDAPVTYKATIEELSKAIVSNKKLIQMNDSDTICTVTVDPSHQTYTADDSHYILTRDEYTFLQDIKEEAPWASTGYVDDEINIAINGLASTGYVTDAITNALGNSPGGTINLTDSYPFLNDSGVLPIPMIDPNAYLMFAPVEGDIIGPPYIQLPGEETATPVNLAGPFNIRDSGGVPHPCANIFVDYENQQISTLDNNDGGLTDINSNYIGNLIKRATIGDDNTQDLRPLFINTNNNTLYYFKNSNWQTVSL